MKNIFLIGLIFSFVIIVSAQQEKNTDQSAEPKELTEVYNVIYKIWLKAYPDKNLKMLKSLIPDLEKNYKKLSKAKLDVVLEEKTEKWKAELKTFGEKIKTYKEASNKNDTLMFLDAAEKLKNQFEVLVLTVKPPFIQMERLRNDIYWLEHKYLPNYEYEKVKRAVTMLRAHNESVYVSRITPKYKSKSEEFDRAKIELDYAVQDLFDLTYNVDDRSQIKKFLEVVKKKYQLLEKIFE